MSELSEILAALGIGAGNNGGDNSFPIPNANFPGPISTVPRDTLNNAAPDISEQQLQAAAAGAVIGFGYGRCRVGIGVLFPIVNSTGALLVPGFVGKGPIDAIEGVELDNAALAAGITYSGYTGTATQNVDSALQAAWLAQGKGYADAMRGTAYIVLAIPSGPGFRFGNVAVIARMLRVYDPRLDSTNGGTGAQRLADSSTWTWSQNPVLALAHFLSTPGFGPEELMDWATVATCADIADQTLTIGSTGSSTLLLEGGSDHLLLEGGANRVLLETGSMQTRRQIGIFFDNQQSVDAIEETLRSYAGVFIVREDSVVRLVADAVAPIVYDFTNGASGGNALLLEGGADHLLLEGGTNRLLLDPATGATANYLLDSLELGCRGRGNSPTVVTVRYTDTSQDPWGAQEVTVKAPGVDDGTTPWVESVIDWPGCQNAGMAYRECVRRINEFILADTTVKLVGTDETLALRRGDVTGVTDADGFSRKPYRVTDVYPVGPGRFAVAGTEYQDGLYSDAVYTGPIIPDSNIPNPSAPPSVTGLTVAEEPYLEQYAVVATQARLSWTAPVWPFLRDYWIVGSIGGVKQFELSVLPSRLATDQGVTPKLRPGELYSFGVYVRSTVATGSPVFIGLRPLGKSNPPSDVASISGFSVGGETFLSWTEATDDDQINMRYELRYGSTSGTWESATSVQKTAALRYSVPGIPVGTWRFFVKAIDSIGQYSANAAHIDLTVTDVGPYAQTIAELTVSSTSELSRVDIANQAAPRWVTDDGEVMGYGHVDTNNATGVWIDANVLITDLFASPRSNIGGSGVWISQPFDAGSVVFANWSVTLPYRVLAGSPRFCIRLSTDGISYSLPNTTTAYLGTSARYAIAYMEIDIGDAVAIDGNATLLMVIPGITKVILNPNATGVGNNQKTVISQAATQAAALELVLPAAAPTAGQVLTVDTVSGGKANLKWA